ncbi:hypothetical protein FGO68_gene2068 [Halteria grandinella]|uniref:Uncharacterized protein n=1 Tax=Halteria grandinella TaxID=5974 RepID=A0A8J8NT61_HALGN|nr:hypothetical protein FGO68_gene2068 [Halteria grandinella]
MKVLTRITQTSHRLHPSLKLASLRHFSTEPPKKEEAQIPNDKELFSEEKMAEARSSIKEKLKQIQLEQDQAEQAKKGAHDPSQFEFTHHHKIGQGSTKQSPYFYSKGLKFPKETDSVKVFQMNHEIYNTSNMVDTMVGGLLVFSSYKVAKQLYILTLGAGWAGVSLTSAGVWSLLIAAQLNYLMQTYLRQVFLVSEIELLSNLEEIRIKTVLQQRMSFSSLVKRYQIKNNIEEKIGDGDEYVVKISDVMFSEKDKPNSPIMRIIAGEKRFYLHKNMSKVQDFELLRAIFSPHVNKIECFH